MQVIRVGDFHLGEVERSAILEVLESGRISEGPKVREFETRWAEYVGSRYCVATSSGFGALVVGLQALKYHRDLPPGTKVITSPVTYIADASAIDAVGFEPVFVDIDPETLCVTPESIEAHLSSVDDPDSHAVLLPVDLMGYATRIDEIDVVAQKYGCSVFEDAAQAHGTIYKGHRTGSQALLGCFSFYIAHNIQAGEMGAIVTSDPDLYKLARRLKAQGRACACQVCTRSEGVCPYLDETDTDEDDDPRFTHELIGFNFKTMEFQATLALTQMDRADEILERRLHNVAYLNERLERFSDILQLPHYDENVSYLAYPVVIRDPGSISRKALREGLERRGVETRPLFGSIPTQQPAYAHLRERYAGRLPVADHVGRNGLYVGCHQYLTTDELDRMAAAFAEVLG